MNRYRCVLLFVLFLVPIASAQVEDEKFHMTVVDAAQGNTIVAEFTTIQTALSAPTDPFTSRVLYKDDSARLLVIRKDHPGDGSRAVSVECLATSEVVSYHTDAVADTITFGFGNSSMVISSSELAPSGEGLSAAKLQEAVLLYQSLTPACRQTLVRLAEIGTVYSLELWDVAFPLTATVVTQVTGTLPATETTSGQLSLVRPFDPQQTPPNSFESQFGAAYYQ